MSWACSELCNWISMQFDLPDWGCSWLEILGQMSGHVMLSEAEFSPDHLRDQFCYWQQKVSCERACHTIFCVDSTNRKKHDQCSRHTLTIIKFSPKANDNEYKYPPFPMKSIRDLTSHACLDGFRKHETDSPALVICGWLNTYRAWLQTGPGFDPRQKIFFL
jgi:hypothetical protein